MTNGRDTVKLIKTNPLNRGFLNKMPKLNEDNQESPKGEFTSEKAGFYKNYAVNWLRKNPDHPKFYLVAEYDSLKKEDNE